MAAFTATQPWSAGTYTTEWYTWRSAANTQTVMPWVPVATTIVQPVKVFRGAQVKTWTGSAWVLAPPA